MCTHMYRQMYREQMNFYEYLHNKQNKQAFSRNVLRTKTLLDLLQNQSILTVYYRSILRRIIMKTA